MFRSGATRRRLHWLPALLATSALVGGSVVASISPARADEPAAGLGPTITHTGQPPTGYELTIRYQNSGATRVQIAPEMTFSDPALIKSTTQAEAKPGSQWEPGDVPANWKIYDMTKNAAGVWSYTTPLPSGTFSYAFLVNCASDTGTGCTRIADPANPNWNPVDTGGANRQVHVPSDRSYGTLDKYFEAPAAADKAGSLEHRSYPSTSSAGTQGLAVYLPPGYNKNRSTPYPTLYLSHGAGGDEYDWSTQGVAGNIVDNAIAEGRMQPTVVVMTNFNGIPGGTAGYATEVTTKVIPYVQKNFNVSKKASDRAFAGLSAGGSRATNLLYNNTAQFAYYGLWSAAGGYTPPTEEQVAAMKTVEVVHAGTGLQDFLANINASSQLREQSLKDLGVNVVGFNQPGVHSWDIWRMELNDFVRRVAFKATTTNLTVAQKANGKFKITAKVAADAKTSTVSPTGRVQFLLDGRAVGEPLELTGKNVSVTLTAVAGQKVTAVYTGNALFTGSTREVTID